MVDGDVEIGVLTSSASLWTFGVVENTLGTIVIVKEATPEDDTLFSFTETITPGSFTLMDPSDNTQTFNNLLPGTYTVTEDDPQVSPGGFLVTDVECDDDASTTASTEEIISRTVVINLDPGETVTCTFANTGGTPEPALIVINGNARLQGQAAQAYQPFLNADNFFNSSSQPGGLVFTSTTPFWDVVVTNQNVTPNNGGFDVSTSMTGTNQVTGEMATIMAQLIITRLPLATPGHITDGSVVLSSLSITDSAGTHEHCGDAAIGVLPIGSNIFSVPLPSATTCP